MLLLSGRHLGFWNRLDLQQGDHGVFGAAFFGGRFPYLCHYFGKGAGQLEPRGPALSLLGTHLPIVHTVELLDWAYGGPVPRGLENFKGFVSDVPGFVAA